MKVLMYILLFLSLEVFAQDKLSRVSGYVFSIDRKEPIALCNVFLKQSGKTIKTDLNGYFKFDSISVGKKTIVISNLEFDTLKSDVFINQYGANIFEFYLRGSGVIISDRIPYSQEVIIDGDAKPQGIVTREDYRKMLLREVSIDSLKQLKNDTIYEKEIIVDPCNNNEKIKLMYFETGNLKHNKKTGEWIAYWNNGNLCYKAKYKQKLKLKKIPISKFVKDKRYPYGKYITNEKLKLRYWMIPIDTLIEYNLNGVLAKTVYFSKRGKILNDVINIYDDQGRLRYVRDLINNKFLEYCPHGFSSNQAQDSSIEDKRLKHFETCKWECYLDYPICPLEPVEGSKVVRAKF